MAKEPELVAVDTVAAEVLRDYWPTENDADRVRAGAIVQVTKDALIEGMEKGILRKAAK